MESTDASYGSQPNLPPGFRFHPTDEELVVHYLKKKATSLPLPVSIIADVDLYKFDPWELPAKAAFGEQEWYFFSPRDRKYPNGARPNRAATSGYWKATGTDKPVLTSNGTKKVGVKKALVFYGGKPPKGIKTNWIMHEYRLTDHKSNSSKPHGCDLLGNKNNSLRLDDWVLCRIYKKNKNHKPMDHDREDSTDINMIGSMKVQLPKTVLTSFGGVIENDHHLFDIGILSNDGLINTTTASLSSHLISSSNSKPVMSLVSDSTMSNFVPLKRSLHGLYWNEDDDQVGLSSSKRMQLHNTSSEGNNNNNNGASNSTISLLSQIPQNPSLLQQQAILGSFADGLFRAPYELPAGINWYS